VAKSKTTAGGATRATPNALPTAATAADPQPSALLDRVVQDSAATAPPAGTVLLASVVEIDAHGHAWLQTEGAGRMQAAHSLVPLHAEHIGQQVAISLMPHGALVLGLLWQPPQSSLSPPSPTSPASQELRVDGQRQVIHAEEEIELRCGEAAIVLTADGHIQLRGTYITSQASATQRILGGSVNVN
jgi:hypothetical protein